MDGVSCIKDKRLKQLEIGEGVFSFIMKSSVRRHHKILSDLFKLYLEEKIDKFHQEFAFK